MKNQDTSLGFIFGYKDKVVDSPNSIRIIFKTGVSKKFPSKYKNYKDFWSQEIHEGQTSDLYIGLDNFKQYFNSEMNNDVHSKDSYMLELSEQRKYYFPYDINVEQYIALSSFSMAHLYVPYQRWENDETLQTALQQCIGKFFTGSKMPILEIYNNYKDISKYIYEQETSEALGETINKPQKLKV